MRRSICIPLLCVLASACAVPFFGRSDIPLCEREAPKPETEPVFATARSLLSDSAWAETRREFGLHGSPADIRWVGDAATCRRLADAIARSAKRPPDYSLPLAAVRIGSLFVVRAYMAGEFLIDSTFRVRTVFVSQ